MVFEGPVGLELVGLGLRLRVNREGVYTILKEGGLLECHM